MLKKVSGSVPAAALFIGAIFSAWASYRMHVLVHEPMVHEIIYDLMALEGRAPDQYRVLPYMVMAGLEFLLSSWTPLELPLRYAIILFDGFFVFLSAWLLQRYFSPRFSPVCIWLFFLLYPMLMFGGYRPTSAWVLCLALLWVVAILRPERSEWRFVEVSVGVALLLGLSFTRADVALMLALCAWSLSSINWVIKLIMAALPIVVQGALKYIIFPDAAYYTHVVMLSDNLGLTFILTSPLTYLWFALLLAYRNKVLSLMRLIWAENKWIGWVLFSYACVLFIVARPDEYRLFLPCLPVVLWLLVKQAADKDVAEKQGEIIK